MKRITFSGSMCCAALVAASTGCAMLGGSGDVAVTSRPSLAGTWQLDPMASSDTASIRTLDPGVLAAPPINRPDQQTGTYRDTVRMRRIDEAVTERVLAAARAPAERFTIVDSAGTITLRAVERDPIVLEPGGRGTHHAWLDGSRAETRVRWVQQRLEIERKLEGGITVREYFSRSPGSTQLVVFTIVQGPFDGEITLRRVYDLAS